MTALPDSIIQNGLFCCWKYEERNGRKTKMPYQPETGLGAKSNDPSSFVPYKTAVQASGYDGIGIGIFNGICAIDLDNCVSDSGYYTQTAAEIVALMHSYTEYSPSGNGLHILFPPAPAGVGADLHGAAAAAEEGLPPNLPERIRQVQTRQPAAVPEGILPDGLHALGYFDFLQFLTG